MIARRLRTARILLPLALGLSFVGLNTNEASAAEAPVGLGTATSFAVAAGTTVTNTGASVISGDVGVSPGSAVVGFPPGIVNNGTIHAADAVATQAQADITTAFNDAAGRAITATVTADLGGQTLVSGVYTGGALGLTGTVTLDAQGDPNAVFIFQAASTLITASSSSVALINGAAACNVFWQIGSSATIGTGSAFVGTVLALTSVAAQTSATINGRLLARNGAVTLDSNVITNSTCASAAPATTTTTTAVGGATTTAPVTATVPRRLPRTGVATSPELLLAFGLVAIGAFVAVRRRHHA
jgi:LPXTG-motif cell wall-anchored protein